MNKSMKQRQECPVCGYLTLQERGMFEVCPVCFWEDEGEVDNENEVSGGANGDLSLATAKNNFIRWGAVSLEAIQNVREPLADEVKSGLASPEEIGHRQRATQGAQDQA